MKLVKKFLSFFLPSFCKICHKVLENSEVLVCNYCYFKLPLLKNYCKKCGNIDLTYPEVASCGNCFKRELHFDEVLIGFKYEKPISNWILEAKFEENFLLAYNLGKLLRKTFRLETLPIDEIIPLPLFPKRWKERGYNQSFLITYGLLGKKPKTYLLERVRETIPQTELPYKERIKNVRNAFRALKEKIEGKKILLVDDVMTTGATLSEASKALKEAGAKKVWVCVVARALN